MIARIGDKVFLSMIALVIMANVTEITSMSMVLTVLFTLMAIAFTDIFRQDAAQYILSVLVCALLFADPTFALLIIPSSYGLFSTLKMGETELHLSHIITERIKADGVTDRIDEASRGLDKTELSTLLFAIILSLAMMTECAILSTIIPVCISLIAIIMSVKGALARKLEKNYYDKYDRARMEQLAAEEKKNRIEKQSEDNAYMAMLQERNRIAREIHDNVGHMLTRAIVQMQAVKIINKDENIKPHLEAVDETINVAMLNIRKSVHELHDESIDLSIMLNEIVKTLPESFKVDCRTSIEAAADTELKNTILGIVREAVTNIAKYSRGDIVRVEVIEHVAFWRIFVFDNGRNEKIDYSRQLKLREPGSGMGLLDIGKRAERMQGTVNISSDEKGFTVLVILPKK